jgi:Flp pilus assembly protein TadD
MEPRGRRTRKRSVRFTYARLPLPVCFPYEPGARHARIHARMLVARRLHWSWPVPHHRPIDSGFEEMDPGVAASDSSSPETFARLIHRGSELLRDAQPALAREHLEEALRLYPHNPNARNLLALSFFQIGHLERALVLFETLLLDNPESAAAKVNLAVVLLKLGRASAARPLLEDVVRAFPDHHRAWGYLGVALEQLGLIARAEEAFLAGHFGSAARRLRERHPPTTPAPEGLPESPPASARAALPSHRRRTLPPDPWTSTRQASSTNVSVNTLQRFVATIRPPDVVRPTTPPPESAQAERRSTSDPPTNIPSNDVEEISVEHTVSPLAMLPPPAMSHAPKQNRPAVPLLDAALSSLLVVPHEATVVAHPTGLVLVGLIAGPDTREGGFAARTDVVHAFAGPLRREPLARRPPPAPEPFRDGPPFTRVSGTGQLVLAPRPHTRLLPLEMDADLAFIREDLVVAFDYALLSDLGRMRRPSQKAVALVRFRGDGVIVLGLEHPFLAFDVHGEETVTLRAESLIGWIGALTPEPPSDENEGDDDLFTFSGEGTVLFRAPTHE